MPNLFRGYLKIKVQKGQEKLFQSFIPSFVEIVKDTEPMALQFEAFANEATGEIIWLESYYDNAGFDFHLANPALEELKHKMLPLQDTILGMYFMASPTESSLAALTQYGIQPTVLNPWPGTIRLTEERNEMKNIQTFVTIDLTDIEAYRSISEQVEKAAIVQPGVLFHRSYQIDKSSVAVVEEYKDSDSLIAWAKVFGENSGNFGSLVKSMTCEVCGTPSPSCKEMLDGWGAIYYKKIAGFKRF